MTMELAAYLRRIGYDGPLDADARTLAAIQRAHLLAVPFENLDILWGFPIALDVEQHYAKIVGRRRGGFCYEQNDLFAWALQSIGFRVTRLGAGVWGERNDAWDFSDEASHLFLRVDLDEPWIADVGFGENFRAPLRLVDGLVQEQAPRAYRLDREPLADGARWTLSSRDATGAWTPGYRFLDVPRPLAWFADRCRFLQTSPTTFFTQKQLCSLASVEGRITLSGREWIHTDLAGNKTVTPIASRAEAEHLLATRFGIATPPHARKPQETGAMSVIEDTATTYATIVHAERDGVARITLDRPDKLNAFSEAMFGELQDALDRVDASAATDGGARVLVLTGAGRGFCAGADLSVIDPDRIGDTDLGVMLERSYNPLVMRLRRLAVPVICAVNGVAAGAGASLALAGDITIATRSASFVLAFARIGLVPDAGSTFFLPQRIGRARAAGLAMLGEKVDAETAERWGLIWQCVNDAEFVSAVDALATRLASAPTQAIVATRKLLDAAEENTLTQQLDAERHAQATAGRGADFREGVAAFHAKRPAVFRGR